MGNSPSANRPGQPPSGPQAQSQQDPPRSVRRDNRHPIPVHPRVAAPPEPSLHQAHGTAVQPLPNNRPKSLPPRAIPVQNHPPSPSITAPSSVTSSRPLDVRPGRPEASPEPARPVDVPNSSSHQSPVSRSPRQDSYEAVPAPISSLQDLSYLTRPPRLPLPIEEEVHTPGSPIIAPTDVGQALEDIEGLDPEALQRPPSNLSSSTVEDDEVDELLVDRTRPTVPTRLEWLRGGDKVYVTGTIFQWNRKTRLHPVDGRPGVFAATISILPGTHHIRFLVDGQMQTSPDLPTTVDFGNNLVNYIEVSPDDVLSEEPEAPSATAAKDGQPAAQANPPPSETEAENQPRFREVLSASIFAHKIPKYLVDFDQPEDTPPYHSAISAIDKLPNPPALPGFLGKPILNAATLIKDDNSVLNMPNHTVLNHLATSSIKNNILAVSATTRYKNKYVTTIMYKPSDST